MESDSKTVLRNVLALSFWSGNYNAACAHIEGLRKKQVPLHVVTVTSEMVLHLIEFPKILSILKRSDFLIVDTISLFWWLKIAGKSISRLPGVDFAEALVLHKNNQRVALFGGSSLDVLSHAQKKMELLGAQVVHATLGPKILNYTDAFSDFESIKAIECTRPDIVFVGFGHGKQEWWISEIKKHFDFPVIFVGVGGSIDMWGGFVTRAPRLMQLLGFEWLWRLMQEPKRYKRIIRATIIFPYRAICAILL